MSKYIIRITNDDVPAPIYFQCIRAGRAAMTDRAGFAKRYTEEELPLAREMLKRLKEQANARDGESSLFEIVDAETGEPVDPDEPEGTTVPQEPEWETRFEFIQTSNGEKSLLQMRRTSDGVETRYTTMSGNVSMPHDRSHMCDAVTAWTDALRAWLIYQIQYGRGGADSGKKG